ncbi:MAG: MFS transporter [Planctomycetales bacterium]|nr:MFS transporter [Planctomycetales bacterium]
MSHVPTKTDSAEPVPPTPTGRARLNRGIVSWCLYDFANSAYSAVIASTIFCVYYANAIVGNGTGEGDAWWGRAVSASMVFVALTSPFLGGIADAAACGKKLWIGYTWVCILCVASFSFLRKGDVLAGFALAALANVGMEGSYVFYNANLPRVAPPSIQGRVSGWGFAVGYLGSIVALVGALPFALADPFRATPIWLLVAAQFALFSLPAFFLIPGQTGSRLGPLAAAREGFRSCLDVGRRLVASRDSRRFLLGYLFYEDGVNTVIVFASLFATTTLQFSRGETIALFLVVQISALAGAFAMARPTDTRGPKFVVVSALLLWCTVVTAAFFVQTKTLFWGVACVAGLGLGSVQAASRAFYARFIPPGEENRYFGFYSLVGKSAAVMGPILFGEMSRLFGSQRPAILSISLLFIIGLSFVLRVREPPARADAA